MQCRARLAFVVVHVHYSRRGAATVRGHHHLMRGERMIGSWDPVVGLANGNSWAGPTWQPRHKHTHTGGPHPRPPRESRRTTCCDRHRQLPCHCHCQNGMCARPPAPLFDQSALVSCLVWRWWRPDQGLGESACCAASADENEGGRRLGRVLEFCWWVVCGCDDELSRAGGWSWSPKVPVALADSV